MPSSLESLCEIKLKALQIEPYLEVCEKKGIDKAKACYEDLVDRFYRENEEMMAPQQYEAAKKDFEYFLRLLELAIAFVRDRMDTAQMKDKRLLLH